MQKNNTSYNQILKSTSIFGGSQVITIIIGIIRTKIVAVLLGTAGIGIISIYQAAIDMIKSLSSLGIDTGSIREIALADSTENENKLNRIVSIFNRWFKATAIFGMLACIALCYPIAIWSFEDASFALPIAFISIPIFLVTLTTGKAVVLQGMRRISYMAQSLVWGSLVGLIIAIPLYYTWGMKAIIPVFITGSLSLYFCTDYYYRKLNIRSVSVSNKEALEAGIETFQLGLFIVAASIINTVSMFLIRTYLSRKTGLDSAGLFQSAWTITNVYLGLILKSMGSDFYPRLSAIAKDIDKVKKLVNEQTYIVLVVASPIIIAMLLFSEFALSFLYSSKFTHAEAVLQWQILGTFFKVLTWPIAFIMLAKHKGLLFLLSELLFYAVYLIACYLLFPIYGLNATGIGYLIAYLVYLPFLVIIGRYISGFFWSKEVVGMILVNLLFICASFYIAFFQSDYVYTVGGLVLISSLVYAYTKLKRVFSFGDLRGWFGKKK